MMSSTFSVPIKHENKMKIKINDKEIELTEEQVKILKEEVNSEKKGLWKPKYENKFAYVTEQGTVLEDWWTGWSCDEAIYSIGNVFKTIEDAQAHLNKLKAIQRVKGYIAENCEVVEDMEDVETVRWHIIYDMRDKTFFTVCERGWLRNSLLPHLKTSKDDAKKVIANCEADLKVIWGIK